jgi:hypothetical protein
LVLLGDLGVVAGMSITFFVFRANTHAAATVQVEENQQVISTGLYGIVRHPRYSARSFFSSPRRSLLALSGRCCSFLCFSPCSPSASSTKSASYVPISPATQPTAKKSAST